MKAGAAGRSLGGALLATFATTCAPPADRGGAPWLTEVTEVFGLDFEHESGAQGELLLPEIMGGGAALFDFDRDGDLDLLLVDGGPDSATPLADRSLTPNRLFENIEGRRLRELADSGLAGDVFGMGVAIGDVDDDGLEDVYVTNSGPDRLYRTSGDGRFEDVTARAGIDVPGWSCSAAFLDYDRDGDLDLFVTQYVAFDPEVDCFDGAGRRIYCGPKAFQPVPDVLLRNDGQLVFTDVSASTGIASSAAAGLGLVCEDFDGDGWPDVYVANDDYANHMWMNQGDGTFVDDGLLRGAAYNVHGTAEAGMGVVAGDFDGDGSTDLFLTHLQDETNTLYRGRASGDYVDVTGESGLAAVSMARTGFGVVAFDVELDGDLDLAVINGRVRAGPPVPGVALPGPWNALAEPNQLFLNDGQGAFTPSDRAPALHERIEISRALASGDIDGDGDVDLLVTNVQGRARLLRNDAPRLGRWLIVDALLGPAGRRALGATVELRVGESVSRRTVRSASGYLSSHDPRVHFSVPSSAGDASLLVRWPDGVREEFGVDGFERVTVLQRGEGRER